MYGPSAPGISETGDWIIEIEDDGGTEGHQSVSAAALALSKNRQLQAFAQGNWQLVKFVAAVDLNGFTGSAQCDDAMLTSAQVLFQVSSQGDGYSFVDQIVKFGEKFRAGH